MNKSLQFIAGLTPTTFFHFLSIHLIFFLNTFSYLTEPIARNTKMNTTVVYGLGIWAPLTLTGTTRPTNNRDSDSHSSVPSPATLPSFHELEFVLVFVFFQVPPSPIFTWYIPLFSLCLCTFVFCVLFVFAFTKAHSYFSFNSYIYCHLSLFWGFCIYTFYQNQVRS